MHHMIGADAGGLIAMPVRQEEEFRMGDREIAEQNRVHKTIDDGVRADAQSEREQRQRAEDSIAAHGAHRVAEIAEQLFEEGPAPGGAVLFGCPRQVAELSRSEEHTSELQS